MPLDKKFTQMMLSIFLGTADCVHIDKDDIIGIYEYGSRLYGCSGNDSDYDFVVITKDNSIDYGSHHDINRKDLDIQIYEESYFQKLLNEHDIMAMECYFQEDPLLKHDCHFELDLTKLRKSISATVSNSWVKAKKKYELPEEDNWIGWKSLWHSFRIADFGIQIATTGRIFDYSTLNSLHSRFYIENSRKTNLVELMKKFKPEHNELMTEFRKLAPKE